MPSSRIDFANASNVFRLQKMGAHFPNNVMEAARRIVQNKGNANDAQLIRRELGIYKTGATKARQSLRAAQTTVATAIQVGQSIDMISRGGGTSTVGVVNLIKIGSNELEKVVKSKTMRTIFENVAQNFFGNAAKGTRAYQSFRGAFRVGVPVLQAAITGWEIGKAIQASRDSAQDKRNLRQGLTFDTALQNNIDIERSRRETTEERARVGFEEGWMSKALRQYGGFDTGYEDEIQRRTDVRTKQIVQARGAATELGVDVQDALAQAAGRKGKSVGELTQIERDQALDEALEDALNPNSKATQSRIDTELALQTPWEKIGDFFSSDLQKQAKRARIAEEKVLPQRLQMMLQKKKDAEHASQLVQQAMTPTERLKNRDAEERAAAEFNSQRSRHRAWAND